MKMEDIIIEKIIEEAKSGIYEHRGLYKVRVISLSEVVNRRYFEERLKYRQMAREWLVLKDDAIIRRYYDWREGKTAEERKERYERVRGWMMMKRGVNIHRWVEEKLKKSGRRYRFEVPYVEKISSEEVGEYEIHARVDAIDEEGDMIYEFKSVSVSVAFPKLSRWEEVKPEYSHLLQGNGYSKLSGIGEYTVVWITAEGFDMRQWRYGYREELWEELLKNAEEFVIKDIENYERGVV
ncbi:MAG: hypothetical protein QW052_06230 [Candidatus Nitrosocaldaceae archaeon]